MCVTDIITERIPLRNETRVTLKNLIFVLVVVLHATYASAAYNACDVLRRMNDLQANAAPMRSYNGRPGVFKTEYYRDVRVSSQIRKKILEWKKDAGGWRVVDDVVVK